MAKTLTITDRNIARVEPLAYIIIKKVLKGSQTTRRAFWMDHFTVKSLEKLI